MGVHAAPACSGTCQLDATTTVPPSDATVWVLVDNSSYTQLPNSYLFPKGTTHTIQVLNQTLPAPNGGRYVWKQWSLNGQGNLFTNLTTLTTPPMVANYTIGQNGDFMAVFQKQFTLSLQFSDPSGQPIAPPSSVTLHSGPSWIFETAYSGIWLDASVWIVNNSTWEGSPNTESGTASFDLSAGPVTGILVLRAFTATVHVVDNSGNPLADASVTATFANQTIRAFNTDNQGKVRLGHVPLGPYSIQINYHGQNMGNWNTDASTSPEFTAKLDVNGSPQSTDPIGMLRDNWRLAVIGFFAGFLGMGIAVRLSVRKHEVSETTIVQS